MTTYLSKQKTFKHLGGFDARHILIFSEYDGRGNLYFDLNESIRVAVLPLKNWTHPARSNPENLLMILFRSGKTRFLKWDGVDPWIERRNRIEHGWLQQVEKSRKVEIDNLLLFPNDARLEVSPP